MADPNKRISELTNTAIKFSEVDHNIPFKRYLRGSKEILRTADYYLQAHQLENAFILYSKYCTLFVEKFPKHPEYKPLTAEEKKLYSVNLKDSFKKAESLKQKLLKVYQAEYDKNKQNQKPPSKPVEQPPGRVDGHSFEEERRRRQEEDLRLLEQRFEQMKSQVVSDGTQAQFLPRAISPAVNPSAPPPPSPLDTQAPEGPQFDRSLKPPSTTSSQSEVVSFSDLPSSSLKNVIMPCDLADVFLQAAKENNDKNIETCGILLGLLFQNKWKVMRVLVPQQTGGSDTCDITNDEEMVAYQDEHNLITLGWIHTHPSQTAFLSSVDQHTHWPYQKFFPEAVAVVCSPKYNETGYFNLSDHGMDFIKDCKGRGFHQHPIDPPFFQNCQHVQFDASYKLVLHDLRR